MTDERSHNEKSIQNALDDLRQTSKTSPGFSTHVAYSRVLSEIHKAQPEETKTKHQQCVIDAFFFQDRLSQIDMLATIDDFPLNVVEVFQKWSEEYNDPFDSLSFELDVFSLSDLRTVLKKTAHKLSQAEADILFRLSEDMNARTRQVVYVFGPDPSTDMKVPALYSLLREFIANSPELTKFQALKKYMPAYAELLEISCTTVDLCTPEKMDELRFACLQELKILSYTMKQKLEDNETFESDVYQHRSKLSAEHQSILERRFEPLRTHKLPASAALLLFQNPQVQKALDLGVVQSITQLMECAQTSSSSSTRI